MPAYRRRNTRGNEERERDAPMSEIMFLGNYMANAMIAHYGKSDMI